MTRIEAGSGLVEDLASLATLDEATLHDEIRARYHKDIIYVSIQRDQQVHLVVNLDCRHLHENPQLSI